MRKDKLDKEEQEILDAFESNQLVSVEPLSEVKRQHQAAAAATMKKDARINIRLSSTDLRALQVRAMQEGIPYQTLAASILHKFIAGQLRESR
ncbi:MAG: antitoxin [Candidatus Sericytochromatia bacterium]|nr:antitoxin [Candidatus Sericytochromatia bacterium]